MGMKRESVKLPDTVKLQKDTEVFTLADREISKILNPYSVIDHPMKICDFTSPFAVHVHIRGYPYYYGGYSDHLRNFIYNLSEYGKFSILLSPIKTPQHIDPLEASKINLFTRNPSFDIDNSIFLGITGPGWFQDDEKYIPQNGRYKIAWTMTESQEAQPVILNFLKNMDEVWCPTDQDVRRFRSHPNARKMHIGYDAKRYDPDIIPADIVSLRGRFVFGVLGSFNARKGIKGIVRAFCRQYRSNELVTLLLVSRYGTRPYDEQVPFCKGSELRKIDDNSKWTIEWELNEILNELDIPRKELPHIAVLDVPIHEDVLPHIMKRFDCLVGFSRGESTWLPGLQALALGIPVIQLASDCSGFMEYLNDTNSFLCKDVRYELADEQDTKGTCDFYEGEKLAKGSEKELMFVMENVRCHTQERTKGYHTILTNGLQTASKWTWKESIKAAAQRLLDIKADKNVSIVS